MVVTSLSTPEGNPIMSSLPSSSREKLPSAIDANRAQRTSSVAMPPWSMPWGGHSSPKRHGIADLSAISCFLAPVASKSRQICAAHLPTSLLYKRWNVMGIPTWTPRHHLRVYETLAIAPQSVNYMRKSPVPHERVGIEQKAFWAQVTHYPNFRPEHDSWSDGSARHKP